MNSPTVGDGLLFDETDSSGRAGRSGLKVLGATLSSGRPVRFFASRHFLLAKDVADGTLYSDIQLRGATITLGRDVSSPEYELYIDDIDKTHSFWAPPLETVPFYVIKARRTGGAEAPSKPLEYVCNGDPLTTDETWSGMPHRALVFQGDLYDPKAKKVEEVPESDPRFNIACVGTAPAKMHLTRHTKAGSVDDNGNVVYPTSVPQRQAMLKMFTADYCGSGDSFTVNGQPLAYADARTHFGPWSRAGELEALWNEKGATCLNTPRLGPVIVGAILEKCALPPSCAPLEPAYDANIVVSRLVPPY